MYLTKYHDVLLGQPAFGDFLLFLLFPRHTTITNQPTQRGDDTRRFTTITKTITATARHPKNQPYIAKPRWCFVPPTMNEQGPYCMANGTTDAFRMCASEVEWVHAWYSSRKYPRTTLDDHLVGCMFAPLCAHQDTSTEWKRPVEKIGSSKPPVAR